MTNSGAAVIPILEITALGYKSTCSRSCSLMDVYKNLLYHNGIYTVSSWLFPSVHAPRLR